MRQRIYGWFLTAALIAGATILSGCGSGGGGGISTPSSELSGRVLDENGNPVEGATVTLEPEAATSSVAARQAPLTAKTDAQGFWRITVTVTAATFTVTIEKLSSDGTLLETTIFQKKKVSVAAGQKQQLEPVVIEKLPNPIPKPTTPPSNNPPTVGLPTVTDPASKVVHVSGTVTVSVDVTDADSNESDLRVRATLVNSSDHSIIGKVTQLTKQGSSYTGTITDVSNGSLSSDIKADIIIHAADIGSTDSLQTVTVIGTNLLTITHPETPPTDTGL